MTAKSKQARQPDALVGRRVTINPGAEANAGSTGKVTGVNKGGLYSVEFDGGFTLAYKLSEFTVLQHEPGAQANLPPGSFVDADPWTVAFSLTNPRKRRGLDMDSLNALAASIKAQGLAQPILVRPLPGTRTADTFEQREEGRPLPVYELVCGERRLRASREAGMETIPMLVRDLSDEQALELQLVENIEREDLDPMEEAEGFALLRDKLGYTAEQIAERIGRGKGESYVTKSMRLLALTPASREAMYDGHLGRSTGLLVARYPAERQAEVLAFIKSQARDGGEPAPFREIAPRVFTRFNLVLSKAVFVIADESLVPAAGACTTCPKRTGAQAGLFGDREDDEDSCTDPDCFEEKRKAHVDQVKATAQREGFKVIDEDEAKRAYPTPWMNRPQGFVKLTDTAYTETGNDGVEREVTFEDALKAMGKKAPKPRVLINPHTGEASKVITNELADKLQPKDDAPPAADAFDRANERPEEEQALDDWQVQRAVLVRMFEVIRQRPRSEDELRRAVKMMILDQEGTEQMQAFLGWPSEDEWEGGYSELRAEQVARIDAMLADELGQVLAMAVAEVAMGAHSSGLPRPEQVKMVQSYGIDILAVRDKVAEDLEKSTQAGDGEDDTTQAADAEEEVEA